MCLRCSKFITNWKRSSDDAYVLHKCHITLTKNKKDPSVHEEFKTHTHVCAHTHTLTYCNIYGVHEDNIHIFLNVFRKSDFYSVDIMQLSDI